MTPCTEAIFSYIAWSMERRNMLRVHSGSSSMSFEFPHSSRAFLSLGMHAGAKANTKRCIKPSKKCRNAENGAAGIGTDVGRLRVDWDSSRGPPPACTKRETMRTKSVSPIELTADADGLHGAKGYAFPSEANRDAQRNNGGPNGGSSLFKAREERLGNAYGYGAVSGNAEKEVPANDDAVSRSYENGRTRRQRRRTRGWMKRGQNVRRKPRGKKCLAFCIRHADERRVTTI